MSIIDLDAIRHYWQSPTGMNQAPPGMVWLAQLHIGQLADEVERLLVERDRLRDLAAALEADRAYWTST